VINKGTWIIIRYCRKDSLYYSYWTLLFRRSHQLYMAQNPIWMFQIQDYNVRLEHYTRKISVFWAIFLRRASEVSSTEENQWSFWLFHPYVPMIVRTNALKTLIYQHNHMCLNPYGLSADVYTLHTCCHQVKVNFHILEMHLLGFIIFHKKLKCRPYIVGCPQDDVIPELVWNTIPMWSRIVEHH